MNNFLFNPRCSRRQALWFITGAVSSIGLNACNSLSQSPSNAFTLNPTSTEIGVTPWIGNAPLYIAQEKGFFREAGLQLVARKFDDITDSFESFLAAQLQMVTPVISEAISLVSKVDYRIILVMDTSAGADALLARSSIKSIADFKGKRVAVPKGGVSHFFLLQVLAEAGLREKDIRIVDVDAETAANAYAAGSVEIACTYSPFLEKANETQRDGRIIYDSSKMPTAIADVYACNAEFMNTNPQAVEGFVRSIFKALNFLKTNRDEALEIAAKPLDLQPEELADQLRGIHLPGLQTNIEMLSDPQSELYLLKSMTALAEFLKTQNQIETVPNLSEILEPRFVMALSQ